MTDRIRLAVIYGSTRQGRLCDAVANWTLDQIQDGDDLDIEIIDPLKLDLPQHMEAEDGPATLELQRRLDRADAFLVITPEYNHSYPAPLKTLIDSAYYEWRGKPAAFVSYGGMSGGLRAVEHLRQVFAEMHVVAIRDSVAITEIWNRVDEKGLLKDAGTPEGAVPHLIKQLTWWAEALKANRHRAPFLKAG